jgi:nicotinamidase/pyrazinamidase
MKPDTTLFYDVDTQRDFILPGGKLYVPGTESIIPALAEITQLARSNGIRVVCSVDRHFPGDRELKRNGGKYDDHCMDGTEGQKKIDETAPLNPLYIPNRALSKAELEAAIEHRGEIIFEKQEFDVFIGNQHARAILRMLLQPYKDIIVYGVFTEVCVDRAVMGLVGLGPQVHVVADAIADIGEDAPATRARWRSAGVEFITLAQLRAEFGG